jgi:hypothetical protein
MNGDAPLPLLLALKASTRVLDDARKRERRHGKRTFPR